jgi:hypothetical protein
MILTKTEISYNMLFTLPSNKFMEEFVTLIYLVFSDLDFESEGYEKAKKDLEKKISDNDQMLLSPNLLFKNYISIVIEYSKYDYYTISNDVLNISMQNSFIDELKDWIGKTIIYKNKRKKKFFLLKFNEDERK